MAKTAAQHGSAGSRVTAIVVTYNSALVVEKCLRSLRGMARILVVDNASRDNTLTVVRATAPEAEIIASRENLGYGRGNNLGFERTETEFALVINPDADLESGAIDILVDAADQFADAAILSPMQLTPDGCPRRKFDVVHTRRKHLPRDRSDEPFPEGPICTWFVSGATLLLRMSALEVTGGFDPDFFLYYEERDLCIRAAAAGYSVILVPAARAVHVRGTSTPASLRRTRRMAYHFSYSKHLFTRKHDGWLRAWLGAVRDLALFLFRLPGAILLSTPAKAAHHSGRVAGSLAWLFTRGVTGSK
jgi:GT2 family glycosyltransferase